MIHAAPRPSGLRGRTLPALHPAILDLTAKNTFILAGEVEVEVPVTAVKPRDIVVLHTGEKISVDGLVISGEALVDESPITGRAEPELRKAGDKVFAGAYVRQGIIHVRAECVGDATYLARIMRLVEDSLENKAPIENTGDELARRLLRIGMWSTLGTLVLTGSLWRAFTVLLVMACPCATVLSASTAISSALSAAAKRGILIKGGRYLEEVGKAEVVCFDKTGTLTTNQPRIEAILNFSDMTENELLLWAYSAEMHNHHPLALPSSTRPSPGHRPLLRTSNATSPWARASRPPSTRCHPPGQPPLPGRGRHRHHAAGQRADGLNDRG